MASKSKLVKPTEWWKHLRAEKRTFWKKERKAYKQFVKEEERNGKSN